MRFARDNSLSLFFGTLLLLALVGQSFTGHNVYNQDQLAHGSDAISYGRYLVSSHFGAAVLENWQSEYLQFVLFIFATIWFVQRGSNESKRIEDIGLESKQKQRIGRYSDGRSPAWARPDDWRTRIYSNSLLLVLVALFLGSWLGQSFTSWTDYDADQREHGQPALSWGRYLTTAHFWERSLQNWQSEFLAVVTMAVFTIYLRQRGSPESKPVGAPHDETASSG